MGRSCNLVFGLAVFILLHYHTSLAIVPSISTDKDALLALKSHISSSDPNDKIIASNWSSSSPVCSWIGITCSSRHNRVTALDISSMQLYGTVPPHVGNLSFLVSLDISNNNFHGKLPEELSHLQRLKFFIVESNNFTGVIPSFISLLPNLRILRLSSNQFHGKIPPSLSNLTKLEGLSVAHNFLEGKIPQELGDLRYMTILDLQQNQLTGSIPPSIFNITTMQIITLFENNVAGNLPTTICENLPNLEVLHIPENNLDGVIPPNLGKCRKLQILSLSDNKFTGTVPKELANLKDLTELILGSQHLQGEIPAELGNLKKLRLLGLNKNEFTGSIPTNIFNISALEILDLSENRLSGRLPSDFGRGIPSLEGFSCRSNNLSGSISASISNSSRLRTLDLSYNSFTGEIPAELGNLKNLQYLDLTVNEFTSSIPTSIFNISTLMVLGLGVNRLSGTLPSDLGRKMPSLEDLLCGDNNLSGFISATISNSSRLRKLDLTLNRFTGPIPESLGNLEYLEVLALGANNFSSDSTLSFLTPLTNCRKLRSLRFSDNPFDGVLPPSVGNFSNSLQILDGQGCKLKGFIPEEIGNVTGMTRMSLFNNELSGYIPKTIERMLKLQEIYLHKNKIGGTIPDVICNLQNLGELDLSGNQITGSVPPCLGTITSLRKLNLAYNRLNSRLPASLGSLRDIIEFNVSSNLLSGQIPLEIGNLKAATLIELSKNNFSGNIPSSIGGLDRLTNFSLAHNKLDGPIPDSLGKILALEFLDLSFNNLSGEIPKSLEDLVYIKQLNISFNKLSGEIPTGGPFANITSQSFLSNDALCGDSRFNVKPCPPKYTKKSRRKRVLIGLYTLLGIGSLFALIVGCAVLRWRKMKKNVDQADLSLVKEHERISYYELEQATEGFSESNLLGNGSFSKVYKGILKDGTIFAAKVFNVQLEGAFKSFDTECEMLRNLRHRNLTKVITSCSNLDFKALVLEYMPNGTLEKWLYSHNFFLDMMHRLDIMIDIASAMDYLHNGYSTPVVHCDLKPSNVLLDQEMVGHVSDFGIAKLLDAGEDFVQTRTIATLGYIAPEYGQDGIVSTSCDVYSFGILMMETFTRMRPSDDIFTGELSIRSFVSDSFPGGIHKVVDANLLHPADEQTDAKMQCLLSIMELALSCTVMIPDARISMEEALSTLTKIRLHFASSCC
ncbi:probable LRR receptor-like serine/threonine-protein kinase At3g47570 [Nicotiana sylvestris]|uniref:non-specific serine/threonine protein kinase n=1 Tax=Nicotiana sylvestris TaxID=4096 RepID=A0A1U7XA20_NICSY|nr:PREDICTED: putative receptor-like protein kinase At3g47110 [Nicotiana sylvestris]